MLICHPSSLIPHLSVDKLVTRMSSNNLHHICSSCQTCRGGLIFFLRDHLSGCVTSVSLPCNVTLAAEYGRHYQQRAIEGQCDDGRRTVLRWVFNPPSLVTQVESQWIGADQLQSHTQVTHTLSTQGPLLCKLQYVAPLPPPVANCIYLWQSHPL